MNVNFHYFIVRHRLDVVLYRLLNFERQGRNVVICVDLNAYISFNSLFLEIEFYAFIFCVEKRNPVDFVYSERDNTAYYTRIIGYLSLLS